MAIFNHAQWFLAGMSIALSHQLSQPVAVSVGKVVPVNKAVQTAQTNSSNAAAKAFEEAEKLYQQRTADSKRSAIVK